MSQPPPQGPHEPRGRRRKRYAGTHPSKFDQKYKERNPQAYPQLHDKLRRKGKTPAGTHISVLAREVIAELRPSTGQIVADCTLGYGGHSMLFMKHVGPAGLVVGFDVDGEQLQAASQRLSQVGSHFRLVHGNFAGIHKSMAELGIEGFDIIFADVGVSSMQIDDPSRGISYKASGPLDLRLDRRLRQTGADVVNTLRQDELARILWEYSDEPDAQKIAQWIVNQRQVSPIRRIEELTRLIFAAKGTTEKTWSKTAEYRFLHPCARTFQALRIYVNDELGSLRNLLRVAPACLKPGGRIGIISFHSGEDRLVKNAFRDGYADGTYEATSPHVIRPGGEEIRNNPRSASAKFRWARRASKPAT
jgi:16S rRNA (cytosine1402-N4)-methyltransferase